ncbi:Integrating conjugative element protein [Pseudomonas coronafaciens pv. zizaniae]|nr:Integrating conjugative element protein [Pseudomonas coronafaciens pv. zizaniae]RMN24421.1 Integrating conjugative element protein [Pseudomonas coronafaciens pv. zizaniae]
MTWLGGNKAGGSGQQPIKVVGDVTRAGYNLLNGRGAADTSSISPSACNNGMVCSTWSSPQAATTFANRVLGEQQQRTCEDCTKTTSTAGVGLTPLIQESYDSKLKALQELISGSKALTSENLTAASSDSLPVTRGVVEALRTEHDQDILAKRLASEVALSEVLGKALLLQRTMFTGSKEPNIAANDVALQAVSQQNSSCNRKLTTSRPSWICVAAWPATHRQPFYRGLRAGRTAPKASFKATQRPTASISCRTLRKVTDHEFIAGCQGMAT